LRREQFRFLNHALIAVAVMAQRRQSGTGKLDRQTQQVAATQLAIAALTFIAEEPERLGRFLALSGIGPESLRAAARERDFLLGVLDYIVGDEALLLAFAEHAAIDPMDIGRARDVLAGEGPQSS
jgi:hypothetical protein